jgi:hypothetical protein
MFVSSEIFVHHGQPFLKLYLSKQTYAPSMGLYVSGIVNVWQKERHVIWSHHLVHALKFTHSSPCKNRLKFADELTGPRAGACQRGLVVLENFDNEKGQWIVLAPVRRRLPAAKGLCSARSRSSARSRCACTSTLASRSIERERDKQCEVCRWMEGIWV